MESDRIIYYDASFIKHFESLKDLLEAEDWKSVHRFLIDHFGCVFRMAQTYWKLAEDGTAFEQEPDAIKRELMRPLSHCQYRMVERSFSRWEEEEDLVIRTAWDFLHDEGRIYHKKAMSTAEVDGFSILLEEVYCTLDRKERKQK